MTVHSPCPNHHTSETGYPQNIIIVSNNWNSRFSSIPLSAISFWSLLTAWVNQHECTQTHIAMCITKTRFTSTMQMVTPFLFIINWVLCYKMFISLCCNLMAQCLFYSFWSFTWFILYKNLAKCWSYLPQPGLKLCLLVLVNLNSVWLKIWIVSKNHLIWAKLMDIF